MWRPLGDNDIFIYSGDDLGLELGYAVDIASRPIVSEEDLTPGQAPPEEKIKKYFLPHDVACGAAIWPCAASRRFENFFVLLLINHLDVVEPTLMHRPLSQLSYGSLQEPEQ